MMGSFIWHAAIASSSSSAAVQRERLQKIEDDGRLETVGTVQQPEGVILTPEQIFTEWRVPTSEVIVEAGTIPLAVMQEINRNPEVLHRLDPRQFEGAIAEILRSKGFQGVKLTPRSADGGKDVTAYQVFQGFPIYFYFECKHHRPDLPVELGDLRALLGVVSADRVDRGVLVTTSRFTKGGREFIAQNVQLEGRDYDDLVGWITSKD